MKLIYSRFFHFLILFALLVAATFYSASDHDLRRKLQYAVFDRFNTIHPRLPTDQVMIVDIDEESLSKLGQWPWPRTVIADLTAQLKAMGAASVTFDIVFAEPDRTSPAAVIAHLPDTDSLKAAKDAIAGLPDNDQIFAEVIKDSGIVVTGIVGTDPAADLRAPENIKDIRFLPVARANEIRGAFLSDAMAIDHFATNLPELTKGAAGNGHFSVKTDIDGIIREVPLLVRYPSNPQDGQEPMILPILAVEALRVALNPKIENQVLLRKIEEQKPLETDYKLRIAQKYEVPLESNARFWVYYRDIKPEEYISAYKIIDPAYREDVMKQVDGKMIFVGTSAIGLRDIRSTPLDLFVPGVEVHVNVLEQILQGKFLSRPVLVSGAESLAIFIAGFLIILCAPFVNALLMGAVSILAIAAGFWLSWTAYTQWGLLLDPVYPAFSVGIIFLVSTLLTYIRSEADRRQVREAFGHYISPAFMDELTKNPEKLKLGGETRDLTVMFTDIRNFTSISERMSPAALIQLMNDFLTPMSDLVMENRGTIDKFMGDAMMAFWNAPLDDAEHAKHACLAALKMNEALDPLNEALREQAKKEGLESIELKAGIGINTGKASIGNMGSRSRFAYSALGDTVNLASRLEGQTKFYGADILIGPETQKATPDFATLELDLMRVKGKQEPVRIFALLGDKEKAASTSFRSWQEVHNKMLASYRAMDFEQAAALVKELGATSMSSYYRMYAERIRELTKNRPGAGWDGVFVATEK